MQTYPDSRTSKMCERAAIKLDPRAKDLTGYEIGYLKVLCPTGESSRNGVRWHVVCRCGSKLELTTSRLTRKTTKNPLSPVPRSCGCYTQQVGYRRLTYKGVGDLSGTRWGMMRKGAQERGLSFLITPEAVWELLLKQDHRCALSGLPIVLDPRRIKRGRSTASLDRIDSTKGYEEDNVQWVHARLNFMKRDMPNDTFIAWCRRVAASST